MNNLHRKCFSSFMSASMNDRESKEKRYCEAQARVRQGSARDGSQGERPQSLNPCQELTLKLQMQDKAK